MSQMTLDDDLFGEAAQEIRADVETHLENARAELPDADAVWDVDAKNILGALNGVRSALDTGDAEEHLRSAKKWFTVGERADAFEDADDLEAGIEDVAAVIEQLESAHGLVGELTETMPKIKQALESE